MKTQTLSLTAPRRLAIVAAAGLAASLAAMGIQPAGAVDTSVTFTLGGGAIATTTATGSSDLGTQLPALGTVTGVLEDVTVVDDRGALVAAWTTTAAITDFTTGGATAPETIGAANVTYTAGALAPVAGKGVAVGVPGVLVTGFDTGAKTVMTATAVGSNAGTFTPTLSIAVPAGAVAGVYTATVTHSTS